MKPIYKINILETEEISDILNAHNIEHKIIEEQLDTFGGAMGHGRFEPMNVISVNDEDADMALRLIKNEQSEKNEEIQNESQKNEENSELEKKLTLKRAHKSGANWFYWIAGLSLINALLVASKTDWSFIVGLGITQLFLSLFNDLLIFSWVSIFIVSVIFVLFGFLSNKGIKWAMITGMFLYFLDGLIFIFVKDWLSVGFHAFVLFSMNGGLHALNKIIAQKTTNSKTVEDTFNSKRDTKNPYAP